MPQVQHGQHGRVDGMEMLAHLFLCLIERRIPWLWHNRHPERRCEERSTKKTRCIVKAECGCTDVDTDATRRHKEASVSYLSLKSLAETNAYKQVR